jgi:hypothetical protein
MPGRREGKVALTRKRFGRLDVCHPRRPGQLGAPRGRRHPDAFVTGAELVVDGGLTAH